MRKSPMFPAKIARNWREQNDSSISIADESHSIGVAYRRDPGTCWNCIWRVFKHEAIFLFVFVRGAVLAGTFARLFRCRDDASARGRPMGLSDAAISRGGI